MTQNGKILKEAMERLSNPKNAPVPRNKAGLMFMQNGGGLLSKSVTCSGCGHSWKSVEGGADPLTCHNCGGMVRMDDGGKTDGPGPKKPQPIYVDNPRDPRLRAYNDSLSLYKQSLNNMRAEGSDPDYKKLGFVSFKNAPEKLNSPDAFEKNDRSYPFQGSNLSDNKNIVFNEKIKPTGFDITYIPRINSKQYSSVYKKPVQPVVYKKPEPTYVEKFGLTNEDVKRAFATKPISKKNGDPYYNLSKGGKNYKIHAQSGGLDYIEEVVVSKPQPNKQESVKENQPVAQQPIAKQAVASPAPVRQYTGSPVYSPGAGSGMPSALVGFRSEAGDTAFIQPDDYQRFAVPAYGRDYIQSQVKKFAGGGQTRNEREMVNGIADILSQVNDEQNRAQIARQMVNDFNNEDVTYDYDNFMEMSKLAAGGMIKRADGSYSRRGMWDNVRANAGSGKKPSREMLEQERKIRSQEKSNGGPINKQDMHSIYDMMPHLAGGGTNNPGFEALPPYVQAKILSNMGLGGYYNPYMEAGGSTFSGNAFYGDGGMYPMYAEAGPVDPNGRWHGEWQDDPMLAEQYGYPAQGLSEDEIIASQDAANVAANPMKPTKIKVDTPKALPGKKGQGSGSIVDFLNSQGAKSDFATRKAVAENVYGFGKYTGSPEQNKKLLAIMSGKEGYSQPQKAYNPNDGNMLRKGFDPSFDARSPQFGKAPAQGSIPQGKFDSFDNRYPQFGSPRPGVPAQGNTPVQRDIPAQSKKSAPAPAGPKKSKADQYIENDPYFFAEESDGKFVKALDAPFTWLRNNGARVAMDQDPEALFELLSAGLLSRGLIGKTKTMPYNPRQIGASGRMAGQKALPGRPTPTGWSTSSGLRSGQYPMRAEGGYVEGQEMDVTPEEMERLRQQGYQFEII